MKKYLLSIIPIITLVLFSCKEQKQQQVIGTPIKKTKLKKIVKKEIKEKKVIIPKHYEHLFVTARSGLSYRDTPKGKILGKYSLNTQLKIIEYTKS